MPQGKDTYVACSVFGAVRTTNTEHPGYCQPSFEVVEQIGFPYTSLPISVTVWGQAHLGAIMCPEFLFLRGPW